MKVCPVVKSDWCGSYDWFVYKRVENRNKRAKKAGEEDFKSVYILLKKKAREKC